jgi:hypothetical protein
VPVKALVMMLVGLGACGSSPSASDGGGRVDGGSRPPDARPTADARAGADGPRADASRAADAPGSADAANAADGAVQEASLAANRDRLLASYLELLRGRPARQRNGLLGSELPGTCDLWRALDPSARAVFGTLTARLHGSTLAADGRSMLSHITKVYWIVGGEGANGMTPGACGGSGTRMIMAMDAELHRALLLASANAGRPGC